MVTAVEDIRKSKTMDNGIGLAETMFGMPGLMVLGLEHVAREVVVQIVDLSQGDVFVVSKAR